MTRPPPSSTLFPYTTLFRSCQLSLGRGELLAGPIRQHRAVNLRWSVHPPGKRAEPAILILNRRLDRKSTRLNSSHVSISYAVFCLKKKNNTPPHNARSSHCR